MPVLRSPPITEFDLRDALRRELTGRTSTPAARLWEEFALERGAARIDLAIVARQLEGFELKSDLDNFKRLADQMHAYNRVFDQITLVTGTLYEEPARALMPRWWGLVVAERDVSTGISLRVVRPAQNNPAQDAHSLAMLLWRDEAVSVLQGAELSPPRAATRAQLYDRLVAAFSLAELRMQVIRCLYARPIQSAAPVSTR